MTLNELENDVLSLVFESELDKNSFIAAANRALALIHTERDRTEVFRFYASSSKPSTYIKLMEHKGGTDERLEAKGKAFSCTVCGTGKLLFTDGGAKKEITFNGSRKAVKEIINTGTAELIFSGDFDYEIHSYSVFDGIRSADPDDIELVSSEKEYEMIDILPRYLSHTAPPKDSYGALIDGACFRGSKLVLPYSYCGEVVISYKRSFEPISKSDVNCVIDVSGECESLLAPLTASYLLLDDNEGLAQYYMNLYRSAMASVRLCNRKDGGASYSVANGWA